MYVYPVHIHCTSYMFSHCSVRAVACQCLVMMAPNVQICGDPIFAHAKWQSTQLFSHLQSVNIELSLAGIGDSFSKKHPNVPLGLKHILWFLLGNIGWVNFVY